MLAIVLRSLYSLRPQLIRLCGCCTKKDTLTVTYIKPTVTLAIQISSSAGTLGQTNTCLNIWVRPF